MKCKIESFVMRNSSGGRGGGGSGDKGEVVVMMVMVVVCSGIEWIMDVMRGCVVML